MAFREVSPNAMMSEMEDEELDKVCTGCVQGVYVPRYIPSVGGRLPVEMLGKLKPGAPR